MKKYKWLYRELHNRIAGNQYGTDGRLPSESEISRDFDVSVSTVRKAVDYLVAQGLVVRRQGNGTFILDRKVPAITPEGDGRQMVMLVSMSASDFYCEELVHMQHSLSRLGYACMQCLATDYNSRDGQRRIEQAVGMRDVAGIVCGPVWHNYSAIGPIFESVRLPVVFVHPREPLPGNFVTADSATGAYQALCHLRDIGCKSLRYFGPDEPDQIWSKPRGIRRFLGEFMPELSFEKCVVKMEDTVEGGHRALRRELDAGIAMDGIVASGDLSAVGIIGAAREGGVRIPGELAVIGFGRRGIATTTVPPLTVMDVDVKRIGEEVVRILHESIRAGKNRDRQQIVVQPRLVPRASTMGESYAMREGVECLAK